MDLQPSNSEKVSRIQWDTEKDQNTSESVIFL